MEGAYYVSAIAIPQIAVLNAQQETIVYTLNEHNVVEPKMVTLGNPVGNSCLIDKGLTKSDRIITERFITIQPDITVRVHDGNNTPSIQAQQIGRQSSTEENTPIQKAPRS
ncbi:hypothetical protein DSUL_50320 [Desulfovibrionales bacterium]